jgi:hypothetical protein
MFAMHNVHVFLQDHESDVQLLPSPLYVDLLMNLISRYTTFKKILLLHYYLKSNLNASILNVRSVIPKIYL